MPARHWPPASRAPGRMIREVERMLGEVVVAELRVDVKVDHVVVHLERTNRPVRPHARLGGQVAQLR